MPHRGKARARGAADGASLPDLGNNFLDMLRKNATTFAMPTPHAPDATILSACSPRRARPSLQGDEVGVGVGVGHTAGALVATS